MPRRFHWAALWALFSCTTRAQENDKDTHAAATTCAPCIRDKDCGEDTCVQFAGDSFCLPPCADAPCIDDRSCVDLKSTGGRDVAVCAPPIDVCTHPPAAAVDEAPTASATAAPAVLSPSSGPPIGSDGGTVDLLRFAIVGDTRPASEDDTGGYPTAIITRIWQDIEAETPHPDFAVMTGDYMYAETSGEQVNPQLDLYLSARANFSGVAFPAMGNHECASLTFTNCGPGTWLGETANYRGFMDRLLGPLDITTPYYTVPFQATDGSWTAKFVFIAANAWTSDQATWLDQQLSIPTTYTFVVRHEGRSVWYAPGVSSSNSIMDRHPYTLLLAGHTHTFSYSAQDREVITGIGGAPLATSINYGYVIAEQRSDGAIQFTAKDYATQAAFTTFAVNADGTPAP